MSLSPKRLNSDMSPDISNVLNPIELHNIEKNAKILKSLPDRQNMLDKNVIIYYICLKR